MTIIQYLKLLLLHSRDDVLLLDKPIVKNFTFQSTLALWTIKFDSFIVS